MATTCKHTKSGVTSDTSPYRLTPHRTIRSQSDKSNYIEFYYLHETSTALSRPRTRRTSYIVNIRMGGTIRVTTGFCFFAVGKVVNFSPESIFSSSHATHYGHAYARMSTEILRTRVLLRNYIFLSRWTVLKIRGWKTARTSTSKRRAEQWANSFRVTVKDDNWFFGNRRHAESWNTINHKD